MLVLRNTFKTFDHKVNKIKSQAKKKYYLQKILKAVNKEIELNLNVLHIYQREYIEMLSKYPTAKDPSTLNNMKFILRENLPELKQFKSHVLEKIAELEN